MKDKPYWYGKLEKQFPSWRIDWAIETVVSSSSFTKAVVWGAIASLSGALLWKLSMCLEGPLPRLMPLLVGLMIAAFIRYFGKGYGALYSAIGLGFYLIGTIFVASFWGWGCGFGLVGFHGGWIVNMGEVGLMSVICGAVIAWSISGPEIDVDKVVRELEKR